MLFSLSGVITVKGQVDFETTPSYNLTVQATETESGLSATTLVIIQVLVSIQDYFYLMSHRLN